MPFEFQSALLILLTIVVFLIAKITYVKCNKHVLLQPLLIAVLLTIAGLYLFDVPYAEYLKSNQIFKWLLGPAVVSLAIPLYQNFSIIRQWIWEILLTISISASLGVLITWSICQIFSLELSTQIALLSKSATTPIALSINNMLNGHLALAAAIVMLTGLIGAMIGPTLLIRMGFKDHRILGISLGLTSHAIGTQKALEISPICGAFSALAMTITGVLLAFLLPIVDLLIR